VKEGGREQTKKLCALLSTCFGLGSQIMSVIILIIIPFPMEGQCNLLNKKLLLQYREYIAFILCLLWFYYYNLLLDEPHSTFAKNSYVES
jgi:hypothetical protein